MAIKEKTLAFLAQNAYRDNLPEGFTGEIWKGNASDQAHIILNQDMGVIAIAGSNDRQDWLQNFTALPVNRDGIGWVHKGFADGADALYQHCTEIIAKHPEKKSWAVVGHSRGGAIALILAALMASRLPLSPLTVRTFGAPMAGLDSFAQSCGNLNMLVLRYEHGEDPVPKIPGSALGFVPVGERRYLSGSVPFWFQWIRRRFSNVNRFVGQAGYFPDHSMENYVNKIT